MTDQIRRLIPSKLIPINIPDERWLAGQRNGQAADTIFQSPRWLAMCLVILLVGVPTQPTFGDEEPSPRVPRKAPAKPIRRAGVVPIQRPTSAIDNLLFLPSPPRELRQALSAGQRAIEDERFADAVDSLAEILNHPQSEDYFIKDLRDGSTSSLKQATLDALGSLPPAGREIYELQFGSEAQRILDQAILELDPRRLAEVTRRFFHTQAGYEASILLGRYHFDHGQPLAAAWHLERVFDSAFDRRPFEPELTLLLAGAWQMAENPSRGAEVLTELHEDDPSVILPIGKEGISLAQVIKNPTAWLEREFGNARQVGAVGVANDWAMFRGNAQRNAVSRGSRPIGDFRWRVPTANRGDIRGDIAALQTAQASSDLSTIPAIHPIAVGDCVLMRGPGGLLSVSLKSGKRIWTYPWQDELESPPSPDLELFGGQRSHAGQSQLLKLRRRIWDDAIYGQISSDDELVFIIHETPDDSLGRNIPQQAIGFPGVNISGLIRRANQLVALELPTEGKTRWINGGQDGDEPELTDAFFMGAPLPLDGQLYALVEMQDEVRLVVLDGQSGKLDWSQQLAHIDNPAALRTGSVRHFAGATPSYAEGILVCPTSAGTVVAVDVATRTLLWGYQYPLANVAMRRNQGGAFFPALTMMPTAGKRWADASVTLVNGKVLLTPVESDELHCLDLFTGKPVWEKAIPRGEWIYLAGVADGNVIIVGGSQVEARNLIDGTAAWNAPLAIPNDEQPSGRGLQIGQEYFLPTTANQLLVFDMLGGELRSTVETNVQLGNLICHGDQILSLGPDWLYSFYQIDHLREIVGRQLAEAPDDPRTLEDAARLYASDGQPRKAIESLLRAVESYPPDSPRLTDAKKLLVDTVLDLLKNDFGGNSNLVQDLDQYIDDPAQQARYLRLLANDLDRKQENAEAFRTYLKLVESLPAIPTPDTEISEPRMLRISRHHQARNSCWINGRLRSLSDRIDGDTMAELTPLVSEQFQTSAGSSMDSLRRRMKFYAGLPVSLEPALRLAEELAEEDRTLEAGLLFAELMWGGNDDVAARSTIRLADLMASDGFPNEAAALYKKAAEAWPALKIDDAPTASEMVTALARDPIVGPWLNGQAVWNDGTVEEFDPDPVATSGQPRYRPYLPITISERHGRQDESMRVALDLPLQEVVVFDRYGVVKSRTSWKTDLRNVRIHPGVPNGKIRGHLLVLSLGSEIIAVDLRGNDRGRGILWRASVNSTLTANLQLRQTQIKPVPIPYLGGSVLRLIRAIGPDQRRIGVLGPLTTDRVCFQQGHQLRAVDPVTGELQWARHDFPTGCDLFGDERHLYVVPPNETTATVLDLVDGQNVTNRPVPEEARRWTTRGQMVVTWDGDSRGNRATVLRVYDVWRQKDAWSVELPPLTRGCLVGQEELALLEPEGRFRIFNIVTGTTIVDDMVEPEPALELIQVHRDDHQYLLTTSQKDDKKIRERRRQNMVIQAAPRLNNSGVMVDGRVYAFDREGGTQTWEGPARIDSYGLPLNQPFDLPVLVFMREVRYQKKPPKPGANQILELLCIDRRDGRLLTARTDIAPTRTIEITGDPLRQTAVIQLQDHQRIGFRFTQLEKSPEPPASTDRLTKKSPASPLETITGAVLGALGDQLRVLGESNTDLIEDLIDGIPGPEEPGGGAAQEEGGQGRVKEDGGGEIDEADLEVGLDALFDDEDEGGGDEGGGDEGGGDQGGGDEDGSDEDDGDEDDGDEDDGDEDDGGGEIDDAELEDGLDALFDDDEDD